jgi:hypothetical protein
MAEEITPRAIAGEPAEVGLNLSDAELKRLLPGVSRSQSQTSELRELLSDMVEPAGVFSAFRGVKE